MFMSETLSRELEAPCGITPEFKGMFSCLYAKVAANDRAYNAALAPVLDDLERHVTRRHKPTLRPEHIPPILARLKGVATFAQRCEPTLKSSKRGFDLRHLRLVTDSCRREEWEEDEPGLNLLVLRIHPVLRREFTSNRGHCDEWFEIHSRTSCFARFSKHALARWYQRSFQPSEGALIDAIWTAHARYHEIMPEIKEDGPFRIDIPGAGEWRGRAVVMPDLTTDPTDAHLSRSLDIRTFI